MYLAPLNYDRFFKKVFSDPEIARKFLEDFLDAEIESIEILKDKHTITDDAAFVEFDFRCKIQNAYVIIDMQQWYKADVTQRFYLYHALNTGLQTEDLPKRRIVLDKSSKKIVRVKDYRALEPVYTLIWMVNDSLKFDSNYVSYGMTPEIVTDFVRNEKLWNRRDIAEIMEQRAEALKVMGNKAKNLDFLSLNRLVFAFQNNIVRNRKIEKYTRWFEFAEKTRNRDNCPEDFTDFTGTEPFDEMMRRLDRRVLTDDDAAYIEKEREAWKEFEEFIDEYYGEGRDEGLKEGEIRGQIITWEQLLKNPSLPGELAEQARLRLSDLKEQLKSEN